MRLAHAPGRCVGQRSSSASGQGEQSLQALRDALNLREIVFKSFPAAVNADLRMFRAGEDHRLELVMRGSTSRSNEVLYRVASVAMRAKLCGFHFTLAEGGLKSLVPISLS